MKSTMMLALLIGLLLGSGVIRAAHADDSEEAIKTRLRSKVSMSVVHFTTWLSPTESSLSIERDCDRHSKQRVLEANGFLIGDGSFVLTARHVLTDALGYPTYVPGSSRQASTGPEILNQQCVKLGSGLN